MNNLELLNANWRGFYWAYILLIAVVLGAVQSVADIWAHYPITTSMLLAVFIIIYAVIQRVKNQERRLANTMAAVVVMVLIDVLLEFALPMPVAKVNSTAMLANDLYTLVLGLAMAYLYLRLTLWSDKKRVEMEQKRGGPSTKADSTVHPVVRHHRWKKKPKKNRKR